MLLTTVIIILREFLEAALIFSVLLAIGRYLGIGSAWIGRAIGLGALGGILFAGNTGRVSEWFDGVGQEVLNATLQIGIFACLTGFAVLFCTQPNGAENRRRLMILMTISVAFAITREGSEILIYISGFLSAPDMLTPILLGALVGAAIGTSVGALVFYALSSLARTWTPWISAFVLALVAAGLASQACLLLIQADWLPSQTPLWNSSYWLAEDSVTGQLLYALIGYEATPTPLQAGIWFCALLLPAILIAVMGRFGGRQTT